ncbi:MAG TPA: hypothetical protein VFV58_00675 [Blastocatellia bacterium]|jgi:hypothetical protein|nr:hypothetical protein [Blastocatellia bacterium]
MKSESDDTPGRRYPIDPRALMNAPHDCEIGMFAESAHGASEIVTPRLRLRN